MKAFSAQVFQAASKPRLAHCSRLELEAFLQLAERRREQGCGVVQPEGESREAKLVEDYRALYSRLKQGAQEGQLLQQRDLGFMQAALLYLPAKANLVLCDSLSLSLSLSCCRCVEYSEHTP